MKFEKSSNIYNTFEPLYKAFKLSGIIPFEMNLRNGNVRVRILDLMQMVLHWSLWMCLICLNVCLAFFVDQKDFSAGEVIIVSGWQVSALIQQISSYFVSVSSLLTRRKMEKFFEILYDVDEMVRILNDVKEWIKNINLYLNSRVAISTSSPTIREKDARSRDYWFPAHYILYYFSLLMDSNITIITFKSIKASTIGHSTSSHTSLDPSTSRLSFSSSPSWSPVSSYGSFCLMDHWCESSNFLIDFNYAHDVESGEISFT